MKNFFTISVFLFFYLWSNAQKQYTISGYISDANSGEKLINANVYDAKSLIGSVSNIYGFYSLSLPQGKYQITFSYVGYSPQTVDIDLIENKTINVGLHYIESLEEVTVIANTIDNKLTDSQMSKELLTSETIKNLPSFMGEADVMKALQLLPGVQSGNEGSTGLYIRGGGPDQNLILLDGVPVYNVNHLFGFFSVFNTDAIKNVSLYKGGFPARFGGRLSSVVDIRMKEGNEKELHGGIQTGLISTKVYAEGPIKKDKTAFLFSARRTYIDALASPLMPKDNKVGYYFYDINAKVNHKFSERNQLYLSAYAGNDNAYNKYKSSSGSYSGRNEDSYSEKNHVNEHSSIYWGNITSTLRWNYIFNNKLFCNTTLTYSRYRINFENNYSLKNTQESRIPSEGIDNTQVNSENMHYKYMSGINDISSKVDFDWYPNHNHEIKFGIAYIYHTFTPGVETFKANSSYDNSNINKTFGGQDINTQEINAFIEDNIEITTRLKTNIGVHFSGFKVDNKIYTSIEPRLSMRYLLTDKITLKAAYSKMQQYLHLLSSTTIGLPTDLWLPVTKNIKPQLSNQYAFGVVYNPSKTFSFSLESYYKNMNNLIEYKEGATFYSTTKSWEEKMETGKGRAYGMELLLKKESGKTTGWVGYTLSKSELLFKNLNFSNWYPAKYDRRHDISIVLNHKFSDKIDFGATWVYGTGNAITLPTHSILTVNEHSGFNTSNDYLNETPYFEKRNNYRMPSYHRMDIGMNFHKKKKFGTRTWNISVYNVYNHKNPFFLYFDYTNENKKVLKQVSLFPILPSISYSYTF